MVLKIDKVKLSASETDVSFIEEMDSNFPPLALKRNDKTFLLERSNSEKRNNDFTIVISLPGNYSNLEIDKKVKEKLIFLGKGLFLAEESKSKSFAEMQKEFNVSKADISRLTNIVKEEAYVSLALETDLTFTRAFLKNIPTISSEQKLEAMKIGEKAYQLLKSNGANRFVSVLELFSQKKTLTVEAMKSIVNLIISNKELADAEIVELVLAGQTKVKKVVLSEGRIKAATTILSVDDGKVTFANNGVVVKYSDVQRVKRLATVLEEPKLDKKLEKVLESDLLVELRSLNLISLAHAKIIANNLKVTDADEAITVMLNSGISHVKNATLKKAIATLNAIFRHENGIISENDFSNLIYMIEKHPKTKVKVLVFKIRRKVFVLAA